jgi:hypothetical protein
VQEELRLKPDDICDVKNPDSLLGNWYVNLFVVDRRKAFLFMNERTFLSFIGFGIKKSNIQKMQELFLKGLGEFLASERFGISAINNVLAGYGSIELTKTNSRGMLGTMNDLAVLYKHFILSEGGFENCDLSRIISKINRTPQRNLGWSNPVEIARELLPGNTQYAK